MRRVLILGVALFLLAACGSSDSSGPSTTFSGTYRGTETATTGATGTTSLTVVVVQNGSTVTGTYQNGTGDTGNFNGTINGSNFSGTTTSARIANFGCTASATLTDGGARVTGALACSQGFGATFSLTRA